MDTSWTNALAVIITGVATLISGVRAFVLLRNRKRSTATGYAGILSETLKKVETVLAEKERLLSENAVLRHEKEALLIRLDDCQQRTTPPRSRRRPPTKPPATASVKRVSTR